MIEQLKKHFGNAFVQTEANQPHKYEWYKTIEGDLFGVLRQSLTQKEKNLLSSLFIHQTSDFLPLTSEENSWFNILYTDHSKLTQFEVPKKIRFTQFFIRDQLNEKKIFVETVRSLFPNPIILIWENEHEGIIIEKDYIKGLEDLQFTTQAIIGDFLIDLSFYVGNILNFSSIQTLKETLHFQKEAYLLARQLFKKNVYNHYEILPFMILKGIKQEDLIIITKNYLQSLLADEEMLKTLQTYLANNMNLSLTAKKLYVHRNSVQYRIDKFIENTGIDIKNFPEAVTVYLLLNFSKINKI